MDPFGQADHLDCLIHEEDREGRDQKERQEERGGAERLVHE
jgi:hypothetical protein